MLCLWDTLSIATTTSPLSTPSIRGNIVCHIQKRDERGCYEKEAERERDHEISKYGSHGSFASRGKRGPNTPRPRQNSFRAVENVPAEGVLFWRLVLVSKWWRDRRDSVRCLDSLCTSLGEMNLERGRRSLVLSLFFFLLSLQPPNGCIVAQNNAHDFPYPALDWNSGGDGVTNNASILDPKKLSLGIFFYASLSPPYLFSFLLAVLRHLCKQHGVSLSLSDDPLSYGSRSVISAFWFVVVSFFVSYWLMPGAATSSTKKKYC